LLGARCQLPSEDTRKELDFKVALPDTWEELSRVERLDTDGDGEKEWVILYAFDTPSNESVAPIRVAIYDVARREPRLPIFYPYHLQAPGWTFLGEGLERVEVRMANVVSIAPDGIPGEAEEIIVQNRGPAGAINRVSIYRWIDKVPLELRKRTDPNEILLVQGEPMGKGEWYQCIGMFAGTLQVRMEQPDRVIAADQHNDRSQLATFRHYSAKSSQNGYLNINYELAEPDRVCIDFAYDTPPDVQESPYPEKIVMAFHKTFNQEPQFGKDYLTEDAKNDSSPGDESWGVFSARTRDQCVKRVSYIPAEETSSEVQSFGGADDPSAATTAPSPIQAIVQTSGEYVLPGSDRPQPIDVEWTLIRETTDPGEPEMWKIAKVRRTR
jgi:hypothetical protein